MARRKLPDPKKLGALALEDVDWQSVIRDLDELAVDRYGIKGDLETRILTLALCLYLERGFLPSRLRGKRGRPQDKPPDDVFLFFELRQVELFGGSVSNRARQLTKSSSPWEMFRGKNPNTLRDRYLLLKDERSNEGRALRELILAWNSNLNPDFDNPKFFEKGALGWVMRLTAAMVETKSQ
jgi:hypothetical protein